MQSVNLCRLIAFSIILAFAIPAARAAIYTEGHIYLNVKNDPPALNSVRFSESAPYEDSLIECSADFQDEHPGRAEIKYSWRINGEGIPNSLKTLQGGFYEGDTVECSAKVIDLIGQESGIKTVRAQIRETDGLTKLTKNTITSLGGDATLREVEEKQDQGLAAMTGFIVRETASSSGGQASSLAVLIFFLCITNLNLLLRLSPKRKKSPNPSRY